MNKDELPKDQEKDLGLNKADAEFSDNNVKPETKEVSQPTESSSDKKKANKDASNEKADAKKITATETPSSQKSPKLRRSWLSLLNFLLILGLGGAAGYYWQLQQVIENDRRQALTSLAQQIATKADKTEIDAGISTRLEQIASLEKSIKTLKLQQSSLQTSAEQLFDLYGRDKSGWQLAEVEYLMRVAQHKLSLENDFAGAAITLQAASDMIALTGDPGLLPVRMKISDEIVQLKTRKRADLVGMTFVLTQLQRQIRVLKPGFVAPAKSSTEINSADGSEADQQGWTDQVSDFVDTLIEIRHEATRPSKSEANIINVADTLEDNFKLARWALLDRNSRQFNKLLASSISLFEEYYSLDDGANEDFLDELTELQKTEIKPQKPDINGSLQLLQEIVAKRENKVALSGPSNASKTK